MSNNPEGTIAAGQPERRAPWFGLVGCWWQVFWREHMIPLLLYLFLAVAMAWPVLPQFTADLIGEGTDPPHNVWRLWQVQQVVLGQQPLFDTPLLYYPAGISLFTHAPGPFLGVLALPFWPLGPAATHNIVVLLGLMLTGYCMYLLARGVGLDRSEALFAGGVLLFAPMVLAGVDGHLNKVFIGGLPLVLLAFHHTLQPARSVRWAFVTALVFLLLLLHDGYQVIFAGVGVLVLLLTTLWSAAPGHRWWLLRRAIYAGLWLLLLTGPLLFAIFQVINGSMLEGAANWESTYYQPDLAQFVLPGETSRLFSAFSAPIYAAHDISPTIETQVELAVVGLLLALVALVVPQQRAVAWPWAIGLLVAIALALGPSLQLLGQREFTEYELPIVLPYAFLTGLPGLDFMRAPGRFMLFGFVGFALLAAFGLQALRQRWPRWRWPLLLLASGLLLLECWPAPFSTMSLPTPPAFYAELAHDEARYGVFDLPMHIAEQHTYVDASVDYQVFQMTHRKGIASGYVSRTYRQLPVFPYLADDALRAAYHATYINDQPFLPKRFAVDLVRNNYRYVVWHHKVAAREVPLTVEELLGGTFGAQPPALDTDMLTVYEVSPAADTGVDPYLNLDWGWEGRREGGIRVNFPATLSVVMPSQQAALLVLNGLAPLDGLAVPEYLSVQVADGEPYILALAGREQLAIPLVLAAGSQTITLTPVIDDDKSPPDIAVATLHLRTSEQLATDLVVAEQGRDFTPDQLFALHSPGWYGIDAAVGGRWASLPTELFLYSPTPRSVSLTLQPVGLDLPQAPPDAVLAVQLAATGNPTARQPLRLDKPMLFQLELARGWNIITLELVDEGHSAETDTAPVSIPASIAVAAITVAEQ